MVRTIRSGNVIEKTCFPVAPNIRPRSARQKGNTLQRKQDANERSATKRLARLLNCNFKPGDLLLSPSYNEKAMEKLCGGIDREDMDGLRKKAEHEIELFLRRLKRELGKQGIELKYIAVTSDMDGDTGEAVRIHHHLVIPAEGIRMEEGILYVGSKPISSIWGKGHIDYRPLSHQDDYTPLAEYLMRQVRRMTDAKKYKPSRNLKKPKLVSERIIYIAKELRIPKGAKLLYRSAYMPGEAQYIRYVEGKKEDKDRGKTEDTARKRRTTGAHTVG